MTDDMKAVIEFSQRGLDQIKRAIADLRTEIGNSGADISQFENKLGGAEKAVHRVSKALKGVDTDATKAGKAGAEAATKTTTEWQKLQAEIKKANAEHRKFKRGQVTGEGGGTEFGGLSKAGLDKAVAAEDAKGASITKDHRKNQAEQTRITKAETAERVRLTNAAFTEIERLQKRADAASKKAVTATGTPGQRQLDAKIANRKSDSADWDKQFKQLSQSESVINGLARGNQSIISQRYALYDVARTYAAIGTALAGVSLYAIAVGAQFESAFTTVERTLQSDTSREEILGVRDSLVDLSTQIPLTFKNITEIATIGNQMGIAKENIVDFTGTMARFASVSGLSIDAVTQAFGGFAAQTGLDPKYFENLGASIAKVGIDSNATEAQILSLLKEITAGANMAGFTADAIVGLSGTLAGLQIAPERARGSLDLYFGTLNRAVANGGQELDNFAKIIGVTSEELDNMVRSGKGAEVMRGFLEGLGDLDNVATTKALDDLNLSQLRVSNTFTRLSNGIAIFDRDQQNANQSFLEGAELQRQYAKTVDDLSSQWQLFINNLNAMIEVLSGGVVPGLAALFQILNDVISGFRNWLGDNSLVASLVRYTAIFVTLVGVFALIKAGVATARGSLLAFAYIQNQAAAASARATAANRANAGSLNGVAGSARMATGALRGFKAALIGTGIGAAAVAIGFLLENMMPMGDEVADNSITMDELANATNKFGGSAGDAAEDVKKLGKNVGGAGAAAKAAVRTLVDYANDLQGVFKRSGDLRFGSGSAMDDITLKWIALNEQAEEYMSKIRELTADRSLKAYWLGIAEMYDDQIRAGQLRADIAGIDEELAKAQAGASTELKGNSKAAIENRQKMRDLLGGYEEYIAALASAGASQEEILRIVGSLNGEFSSQAQALGFSGTELITYTDRFRDLSKIIEAVPRNITVDFNADPALLALAEFFAKVKEDSAGGGGGAGGDFGESYLDGLNDALTEGQKKANFIDHVKEKLGISTKAPWEFGKGIGTDVIGGAVSGMQQATNDPIRANDAWIGLTQGIPELFGATGDKAGKEGAAGVRKGMEWGLTDQVNPMMNMWSDSLVTQFGGTGQKSASSFSSSLDQALGLSNSIVNYANSQAQQVAGGFGRLGYNAGTSFSEQFAAGLRLSASLGNTIGNMVNQIRSASGGSWSTGGYTGAGHWLQPAGVVHKGEYVVPKRHVNQSTGLPEMGYMSSLQRGSKAPKGGYANGGYVGGGMGGGVMELGPMSLNYLANALSLRMDVDSRALAASASRGDSKLAWAGSN